MGISKLEDDYYLIKHVNPRYDGSYSRPTYAGYYICDQFDGSLKCIKDLIYK